jgi:hypothetical protein
MNYRAIDKAAPMIECKSCNSVQSAGYSKPAMCCYTENRFDVDLWVNEYGLPRYCPIKKRAIRKKQ